MYTKILTYINDKAIFEHGMKSKVILFLDYLRANPDEHYFPLSKIKCITGLNTSPCMTLARFFCSPSISLMKPEFIYAISSEKTVKITKSDFNKGLKHVSKDKKNTFTTQNGETIEGFDKKRLKFYFARINP